MAALASPWPAHAALPVLVEFFDAQGRLIAGPVEVLGYRGAMAGISFLHEWAAPIDPVTGSVRGAPQFVKLELTMPVGSHSPVLANHQTRDLALQKVVVHFVHPSPAGVLKDFYRLTIGDVRIALRRSAVLDALDPANEGRGVQETIGLVYRTGDHEAFDVEQVHFLPGDTNGDLKIDISDPIHLLGYLFSGGAIRCLLSGDVNADGTVDISDPVTLLNFLFSTGRPPPSPFPDCGEVPPGQAIPCDGSACDTGL
jgi:type VI protein secretion system component Hcp